MGVLFHDFIGNFTTADGWYQNVGDFQGVVHYWEGMNGHYENALARCSRVRLGWAYELTDDVERRCKWCVKAGAPGELHPIGHYPRPI